MTNVPHGGIDPITREALRLTGAIGVGALMLGSLAHALGFGAIVLIVAALSGATFGVLVDRWTADAAGRAYDRETIRLAEFVTAYGVAPVSVDCPRTLPRAVSGER